MLRLGIARAFSIVRPVVNSNAGPLQRSISARSAENKQDIVKSNNVDESLKPGAV